MTEPRRGRWSLGASALLLAALSHASPAGAATWHIAPDGGGDFPTIQAAFDSDLVQSGDEIELADGVFSGPGNRDLDPGAKEFVLRSAGGVPQLCILDAEGVGRGLWLHGNQTASTVIRGLTIRNGRTAGDCPFCNGGAILCADSLHLFGGASPLIVDCIFRDCEAEETGGAIFGNTLSAPTIRDCRFVGNEANEGGALCLNTGYAEGPLRIERCLFDANRAQRGGAMFVVHGGPPGAHPVEVDGCLFRRNVAAPARRDKPAAGGGIYLWGCTTTVDRCTFEGNSAAQQAGSIQLDRGARLDIRRTIVAAGTGSALDCDATSEVEAMTCCNLHQNSGGDWVGCVEAFRPELEPSNLSADPAFCDAAAGDYYLEAGSPCLPGGLCPEGMGAHPQTCEHNSAVAHPGMDPGAAGGLPALLAPLPNPASGAVRLRFAFDSARAAGLIEVLDPAGRLVWRAAAAGGSRPGADAGEILWPCRDARGRSVPAGLYLVRLRAGDAYRTRTLVLLR